MVSRCLPVRYSTPPAAMMTASGSGVIVTVAVAAAEETPPPFVAVRVRVTTDGVTWPSGRMGAAKVTRAVQVDGALPVQATAPTATFTSAGAPAWATVNVTAPPPGLVALTVKLPAPPEGTVTGATWATVGAAAALTVTVAVALEVPQALVTTSVSEMVWAAAGAVKTGPAMFVAESVPAGGAPQANVRGGVPLAVAARVTAPPEATVYGPPALAVGGVHPPAGTVASGHGLSWPAMVPVEEA